MGYTLQLQWTFTPPAGRPISLADIILPRVLENYNLHTPSRSTIQLRTYRASFPSSNPGANSTSDDINAEGSKSSSRYLTAITTLPTPSPTNSSSININNGNVGGNLEDITYLFLDDRSVNPANTSTNGSVQFEINGKNQVLHQGQHGSNDDIPIDIDQSANGQEGQTIDLLEKDTLDEDGFEIIDSVKSKEQPNGANANPEQVTTKESSSISKDTPIPVSSKTKIPSRYKILVVRPTSSVQPMLQSLLSPFIMGLTKSARATASTTSSLPTPTALPGSSLLLTVLTFSPSPPPFSHPIILRIFILPNPSASSIFLEAEYTYPKSSSDLDSVDAGKPEEVCKSFLEGCLIEGQILGEKKWSYLDEQGGWEGIQRNKKSIFSLAQSLREASFI
ncbi:uncharacterized protein IL334_000201 [Kwoniella shivajii]|uniref:Mitochondrial distribution and morphology protein 12 n=1 Tax=Kwoniella shivajii TaxID=564305 RepID=A0ABZ1CNH3_9TREE|nr:hypothetical protein IL334_000201 [Kwoniella shivajii]